MAEISTLRNVFSHIDAHPWNFALYLPRVDAWSLDSRCAVLDPNDCDEDEEQPAFASENDLRYALTVQDVQSIIANAREQRDDATDSDILQAFQFYFDHDAYVRFRRKKEQPS